MTRVCKQGAENIYIPIWMKKAKNREYQRWSDFLTGTYRIALLG
jgi:hypothetical protein